MKRNKRAAFLAFWVLILAGAGAIQAATLPVAISTAPEGALDFYLKAVVSENQGDKAGALAAYQAALNIDPDSGYLLRQAADLALEAGDEASAGRWAEHAVAVDSTDAQSYLLLGRVEWSKAEKHKAAADFSQALRRDPSSTDAAFSEAEILAGDSPDQALDVLNRFSAQNPGQEAQTRYEMAKIDILAGRLPQARRDLDGVADLDPELDTLESRYALAQAYEIAADTPEALAQYQDILSRSEPSAPLLDRIAELSLAQGDLAQAQKNFAAAQELTPSDPEADDYLAALAEHGRDFSGAAAYIDSSAALGQDPALSLRLSYDLTQADRTGSAVSALETAHARWPGNDELAYFLALGCRDLGQNARAEDLLRAVLKDRPDFRDARFQLGSVLESQNKMAQAEAEFDALLSSAPDDAEAANYLGYSLADRGLELPKAEALLQKAVRLDPNNGAYVDSLGWAYFQEQRSSEAAHELLRAVSLIPDDETIWGHVGRAEAASGNWPAAWKALMRSASLAPNFSGSDARASPARGHLSDEQLGALYLDYLRVAQGGLARLSGLCSVRGSILGHGFSFSGLLSFQNPGRLDLEWMGPLFTPLVILRQSSAGFSMTPEDPTLGELDPRAVKAAAAAILSLLNGYLSGAVYDGSQARYERSWFKRRVQSPSWVLTLNSSGLFAEKLVSPQNPDVSLSLGRLTLVDGRVLPEEFRLSGQGFEMDIVLEQAHAQFEPLKAADLAP